MKRKFNFNTLFKILWFAICIFWCGWFAVKILNNTFNLIEKSFFAAGILVILIYIFLRTEEKNKKRTLADTIQHYNCYKKYILDNYKRNSYELYLSSASNSFIISEFLEILKNGIIDARTQFTENRTINSLYTLFLFKKEILSSWSEFEGLTVKIPCFIGEWDVLSVLPIYLQFHIPVGDTVYAPDDFDFCIRFNKTSDENDPLNQYYFASLDSDGYSSHIRAFVNVYGNLQKDEHDNLILTNCRSELADFKNYCEEITPKK